MPTVAVSTGQAVLIGVAAGLFVAAVGFGILSGRRRRRQAQLDIPAAMRPGPSDPDLEKPVLEKMLAFGTLFTVIMALWMPIVFLRDPGQNKSDTQETVDKSVERGQQTTEPGRRRTLSASTASGATARASPVGTTSSTTPS